MDKKYLVLILMVAAMIMIAACSNPGNNETESVTNTVEEGSSMESNNITSIPEELEQIPDGYLAEPAEKQGVVETLNYQTYEAFSYEEKSQRLDKTAYVYLPYDYDENKNYNIFYLMHGGWSNETTYLGTPDKTSEFKNLLDNAIADGKIEPLIVVCPTYNNTSEQDSADYSLALQLTDLYHQELINDLIPAVEGKYSTYAEGTSPEDIMESRDHRGFGGFSMGSVTTWRVFEHCLDYFHYFMPMSGNVGNGTIQDQAVENSEWDWNDFFIYAASGTEDFAYSSFKSQVMNMAELPSGNFIMADSEAEGNLSYREQEGAVHDYLAAYQYIYNGLEFLWTAGYEENENVEKTQAFTAESTVGDVIASPEFEDFGRLLFPTDKSVSEDMTLNEVSSSSVYTWYSNIKPDKTVEIINYLHENAEAGEQIFYRIYTEEEIADDSSKQDTGLFFFKGNPGETFAIMNAGGGFAYVGAMHDSFPHALEVSRRGYNAFALIYRPDYAYEDLAAAIVYIEDHAEELGVDPKDYSLWGGSAGARMAAELGNSKFLSQLTQRDDIPQAAAVIMQYTGYSVVSEFDAPTYACVGKNDGIASWNTMKSRLESLENLGIPTEFHVYDGLTHGFGLGTDTVADGWINDAVSFWENNRRR